MADPVKELRNLWQSTERYRSFGPVIRSLTINGFRWITDLQIDFDFPVTAFSGLNGSGKSTVAQLCICAYKAPSTAHHYKRYYVKDFFPASIIDPAPFEATAKIKVTYETDIPAMPQETTVSRTGNEWQGYKRQPERQCFYVGFTLYIPNVERRDLTIYRSGLIVSQSIRNVSVEIRNRVATILSQPYNAMEFHTVGHGGKEVEVGLVERLGAKYSENNMGFGEGRTMYMIDLLETSPERSFFVLEEPETSLHQDAQHQLARYLLDVASRRRHQIIITTHSTALLNALPPEARKFISRSPTGTKIYERITAGHAKGLLSAGNERDLRVCVEDDVAKKIVEEIIRRFDHTILKSISIHSVGSTDAVREAVRLLRETGIKAIGVRDADKDGNDGQKLYKLPGTQPPELEIFSQPKVIDYLISKYGFDFQQWLRLNSSLDHHKYIDYISKEIEKDAVVILDALAEIYVRELPDAGARAVFAKIQENS